MNESELGHESNFGPNLGLYPQVATGTLKMMLIPAFMGSGGLKALESHKEGCPFLGEGEGGTGTRKGVMALGERWSG